MQKHDRKYQQKTTHKHKSCDKLEKFLTKTSRKHRKTSSGKLTYTSNQEQNKNLATPTRL